MIYYTASNAVLVFLKSMPTRKEFLSRSGVRENSYAGELVLNLYDEVFVYSKNLREEYLKYYNIEYPNFTDFADSVCSIPTSLLPKIDNYFKRYAFIIHFGVPYYLEENAGSETDTASEILSALLNTKFAK
jgi:hypothetical protein